VPPITRRVPGSDLLAIGFAQTSRLAVGITIDPISLAVSRVFTESQSSPLWSVLPVNEEKLAFHTNRAASTLRSTTTIPSRPPLAFGLGRDGLAVRGPDDVVDRLLWKADWDTVSIPEIDNVSEQLYMTALRAGGERGSILLGKIAADGSAQGELQALAGLEGRLDSPSLFVTSEQVYVAVAAGAGSSKDTLYVATTSSPDLPKSATEVMKVSEGITSARLTSVADGKLLLQYTEGAIGDQRVVARVLDQQLKPEADLLELSPSGRDAYEGTVVNHQGTLLSLFFVRHQHGHELWLARLQCE